MVKRLSTVESSLFRLKDYILHNRDPAIATKIEKMTWREKRKRIIMMRIVHSNAAGIDIGAKEFFVAIPEDGSESSVRKFECFTDDLHKAAKWMKDHRIDSVAMESTGVY